MNRNKIVGLRMELRKLKKQDARPWIRPGSKILPATLLLPVVFALGCTASLTSSSPQVRIKALGQITDQHVLAKVAMEDEALSVCRAAIGRLTDQRLLAEVAMEHKDERIRRAAVEKLTDQNLLFELAMKNDVTAVRRAALDKLTDQKLLFELVMKSTGRRAPVERLTDQGLLARVVIEHKDEWVRRAAVRRVTDQKLLFELAMGNETTAVRAEAAKSLTDQDLLSKVVENSGKVAWEVRQAAFQGLNEASLAAFARGAFDDPAVALAARIRLGQGDWDQAFGDAESAKESLGDVLGAAALVDSPRPTPSAVVAACHAYIRQGDVSRIPELRELLLRYGNKALAEDYLNCGRIELEEAGKEWARRRGYIVSTGIGSSRVRWGSDPDP